MSAPNGSGIQRFKTATTLVVHWCMGAMIGAGVLIPATPLALYTFAIFGALYVAGQLFMALVLATERRLYPPQPKPKPARTHCPYCGIVQPHTELERQMLTPYKETRVDSRPDKIVLASMGGVRSHTIPIGTPDGGPETIVSFLPEGGDGCPNCGSVVGWIHGAIKTCGPCGHQWRLS
jgi:hypothetical protein